MRLDVARVCAGLAYTAVALGTALLAWPILLPGFLVGHDAAAHQTYSFLFTRALAQGQVPVRWVEGVAAGLGQPLFNHYQVGFYYLVALLDGMGSDLATALKLAVVVAWAGGGVFMFLLCRPLGSLPAALAAAVFTSSPYLLVDVYVRSAYPELLAIALAPGVLWAADGVMRTGRRSFQYALALTSACLAVSHLPTALIIAPVFAAAIGGSWVVHRWPLRRLGNLGAGLILGAGLSAFYLLPAVLQLEAIQIDRVTTEGFDFHRHFVRPEWWFDRSWGYAGSGEGAEDQMSLQLGRVQWSVLLAALVSVAASSFRRRLAVSAAGILVWLAVVGGALFMMTAPSAPIWEAVGPLVFVQFPWRLLMVPAIACGVLAAMLLSCIRERTVQAMLVLCVVAVQWYETKPYREMASTRERATVAIADPAWPAANGVATPPFREAAYDPVSVRREPAPAPGRWAIESVADVTALSVTDAEIELSITAPQSVTLVIHSPFVPGWHVRVDRESVAPEIDVESGYMRVHVPAGTHRVHAAFERDGVRLLAELITLLSGLTLVLVAGASACRDGNQQPVLRRDRGGDRLRAHAIAPRREPHGTHGIDRHGPVEPPAERSGVAFRQVVTAREHGDRHRCRHGGLEDAVGERTARVTGHEEVGGRDRHRAQVVADEPHAPLETGPCRHERLVQRRTGRRRRGIDDHGFG
jgi:hypothetical protein